jgi:hypothetical protein
MSAGGVIAFLTRHVGRTWLERIASPSLKIVAVAARGDRVRCPVCGGHFRWFLPYGHVRVRRNALCPNCLALERHRLLWLYLQNRTDFFEARRRVLHVAPERCFLERFRVVHRSGYVTVDLESPLATLQTDVQDLPLPDDSFDVVICNHVLEHVEDDLRAMRELHRVLAPGGWAILQSPIDSSRPVTYEDPKVTMPADREKTFGQRDHVRIYGRDYGDRLAEAGFDVSEDDFVRTLPANDIARYALSADEIVFVCRK